MGRWGEDRSAGGAVLPAGDDARRGGEGAREHPEVAEAWSVTGEADAIARVRTEDNRDLERLIIDLQRNGLVQRTGSQVVLSRLVSRPPSRRRRRNPRPTGRRGTCPPHEARPTHQPPPAGRPRRSLGHRVADATGSVVSRPLGHSPDYDLVAGFRWSLVRVQVKTSTYRDGRAGG